MRVFCFLNQRERVGVVIRLSNVDVVFASQDKEIKAVSEVDLTISKGQIYGIVGYSGAGKSTLLRTINLLQRPSKGSVEVNGIDITNLNPKELRQVRKKIGMIFQDFNLLESRTIAENVAFPLKGSNLSKKDRQKRVIDLLHLVGLANKSQMYPCQLSGGQKQRVAIARALANQPEILLCDEATSALDPRTTQSILKLLRHLNKQLGLTIVLITHEMQVVKELCHRVAVMENGRIIEEGSIVDIFTRPQEKLTQEFIDTDMNFDREIKIAKDQLTKEISENQTFLVRMLYTGQETTQPIIARLAQDYQVLCNILFGQFEVLQGVPVGNLLVVVNGQQGNWAGAKSYLESQAVQIYIISGEESSVDASRN